MIAVHDLEITYGSANTIAFPNWEVMQGEQALILGASGSGKTSLLHMLAGLLRPSKGKITVADTDPLALSASKLDKFRGQSIGLVFQKPHLLPALTVEENLKVAQRFAGLPLDSARITKVLSELKVADRVKAKPYTLSQGEAQRVSIARALLNQPKVILADEPTSALDDENCAAVMELLTEQAKQNGATLVMATHDQRVKSQIPQFLSLQKQ